MEQINSKIEFSQYPNWNNPGSSSDYSTKRQFNEWTLEEIEQWQSNNGKNASVIHEFEEPIQTSHLKLNLNENFGDSVIEIYEMSIYGTSCN